MSWLLVGVFLGIPLLADSAQYALIRVAATRLLPELRSLSIDDRRQFLDNVHFSEGLSRSFFFDLLNLGVGTAIYFGVKAMASAAVVSLYLPPGVVEYFPPACALVFVIAGATFGRITYSRSLIRRKLRGMLVERGMAVCISCGYDLRGLTEQRCPECGEAITARK